MKGLFLIAHLPSLLELVSGPCSSPSSFLLKSYFPPYIKVIRKLH